MFSYLINLPNKFDCKIIKKSHQIIVLFSNSYHLFSYVLPGFLLNFFIYFLKQHGSYFLYFFTANKVYLQKIIKSIHSLIHSLFWGSFLVGELRGRNFKVLYNASGRLLIFVLGLSHFVVCKLPSYIVLHSLDLKSNTFVLFSYHKRFLTTFFSFFRQLRKLDSYKGKGIFLYKEFFSLKVGKKTDY